ncbi:MAG: hypothetical protein ABSF54_09000 [Bryobacteraceae bacterium]|jgi:hypothetical protein
MAPLEDELRSALRRREPSPDFTERVLARVAAQLVRRQPRVSQPWVRWVAGIAAALLLSAGGLEYRHYRGEQAKDQLLLAVRIAGSKLNKAQRKVQMVTHRSNS